MKDVKIRYSVKTMDNQGVPLDIVDAQLQSQLREFERKVYQAAAFAWLQEQLGEAAETLDVTFIRGDDERE